MGITPLINKVRLLWKKCHRVKTSFFMVVIRHLIFKLKSKQIFCSNKVIIYGLNNITTLKPLEIGLSYTGFTNPYDRTFLNVEGELIFRDNFSIAKGCRFDIGKNAVATFGSGYVNSFTTFIIMNGFSIGDGCIISWGCQFLDEDFHKLHYLGKTETTTNKNIVIGSHVWIGSNVSVLKGCIIPDGCVVASGSVVSSKFSVKNALIAGNPAKIIRENIYWK